MESREKRSEIPYCQCVSQIHLNDDQEFLDNMASTKPGTVPTVGIKRVRDDGTVESSSDDSSDNSSDLSDGLSYAAAEIPDFIICKRQTSLIAQKFRYFYRDFRAVINEELSLYQQELVPVDSVLSHTNTM